MSELILQALMQLFAIGAALERLTQQSRGEVENFLRQTVSLQRVPEYLRLFDEYMVKFSGGGDDVTRARKKVAFSSVRALRICTEINKELNTRQKYIVFLRLAEFMNSSELEITEEEIEFLDTVANVFNIEQEEAALCQLLASRKSTPHDFDSSLVLSVTAASRHNYTNAHQHIHPDVDGQMIFLHLKRANIFFLRYIGQDALVANGQPVDPTRITVLTQGAVIRSTKLLPLYYRDLIRPFLSSTADESFRFSVKNLEYVFPNGKKGLHDINFSLNSGNLCGIMGSSGAGKSTLLGVLNGSARPTSEQIMINGADLYEETKISEGLIGNIPQDDLLIEELTVFQNLFYNTKLCFGELGDDEITLKVNDVLESLGLAEIKDLRVGNVLNKTISGGQRKRLNIGLELVREPSILFVDEPTSGLSSRDAENVMDLLKQLALSGKLVFVVIHQPSSDIFRMFDQLLMLDTGGYPVYFGNPSDALIYFKRKVHLTDAEQSECPVCGNINPEQLFNIIELHEVDEFGNATGNRKITPKEWNDLYRETESSHVEIPKEELNIKTYKKASPFKQWKIFFTRDFLSRISNKQYILINLLEAPALAIILGFILRYSSAKDYELLSNPNLPAYLFIGVIVALFLGLSVSAEEIIRDRKISQREKFLHLSRTGYLLSKVCLLFLISAIQCASFVIIGNAIMGIHDMNFVFWVILFTTSCFANLLGLNISAALDSAVTVYILIPFLLIPQILLSGVFARFDKLHPWINSQEGVPLIGNVMTSRWAYEALAVEQFANNPFEAQFFDKDAKMSRATFKKDWWVSALRERLDKSERLMTNHVGGDSLAIPLNVLRFELSAELSLPASKRSYFDNNLQPGKFNAEVVAETRSTLDNLKDFYIDEFNAANEAKEAMIARMTSTPDAQRDFLQIKNRYENESLEETVRNSTQSERLIVTDQKVIQRFEPIFHYNPTESFFGAPLYSSVKNVGSSIQPTTPSNMFVIWGMTILLYLSLHLDLFRKVIGVFGKKS
ncbi:MAG: ATP-binding cassette domain-containing protein [Bacteroidetes bacterium]|nr:ATP-binding cassette domain-containing protein [Bacteroidota bacterium]